MIVNSIPDGITFEQFMGEHSSCPRNRLIARAFYLAGFIESWGRGIGKIRDEFVANGLEAPVYKEEMGGMSVYITRRKGLFGENDTVNDGVNIIDNKTVSANFDGVNDTVNGTVKDSVLPFNLANRIVEAINANCRITYDALAGMTGASRRTISREIKMLSQRGVIKRVGSDKTGHWEIGRASCRERV